MQGKQGKQVSEGIKKNQSLRKALQILEGMTHTGAPSRLQDLARELRMPQSTLLRFLNTFIDFGYVGQDPETCCYYLTLKLVELGARAGKSYPFVHSLSKYIKQAAAAFNESSSLCVERDMQMVYIATEEGPGRMLQTLHRIGHIAPMHATGVGKLHLLNYSDRQLEDLEKKRGLPKFTEHTIVSLEALRKELAQVRDQGYAYDNEECEEGVRCIAAPILNYQGQVAAAISISAPVTRMGGSRCGEVIDYLKDLGLRASRELGYSAG
ncbi:MAG: IclR family transcriptional regulator [Treponema sp.]|jgi:DNA-binding IclR family transcriptional regulator|nr:IclR family transcriptional regulator [Treponema sp.]